MWNFIFDTMFAKWFDWWVRHVPRPVGAVGCVAVLFALLVALLWVLLK